MKLIFWKLNLLFVLMSTQLVSQTQSDSSDNMWTIVMPKIVAKSINMGEVSINTNKDSIVTEFVSNIGNYKFNVNNIYIDGIDKNDFKIVSGFPIYTIFPNSSNPIEINFTPSKLGNHYAQIFIISQADTLVKNLIGLGVSPKIKVTNSFIDFGKVRLGKFKDTINCLTIENLSTSSIFIKEIKHNLPNLVDFSTIKGGEPFSIMPGESHQMNLRFTPSNLGRTSGTLEFHFDGDDSPAIVQLYGNGVLEPNLISFSPLCEGDDLILYSDSISNAKYYWNGPNGFTSTERKIVIRNATTKHAGKYFLYVTYDGYTSDTLEYDIIVNQYIVTPSDNNISFLASAEREEDYIKLTNAKRYDYGALWHTDKFSFKHDFETTFSFKYKKGNNGGRIDKDVPGADGIAFVIQNRNNPVLGEKGGDIGYSNFVNSMAVEIDLFHNDYDPNGNHVAVQSLGNEPNTANHNIPNSTLGLNSGILKLYQDTMYYVKIAYNRRYQQLSVYIDSISTFSEPALVINNLDIVDFLNLEEDEFGYIGFTSATGGAFQEHYVYNWIVPCKNRPVSVKELNINNEDIVVYPNPASDYVDVKYIGKNDLPNSISIFNLFGLAVPTSISKVGTHIYRIDINVIPTGVYFININGIVKKIVKN